LGFVICYLSFAMVHPTAIVDAQAQLDSDVVIGPYVLIEGPVKVGSGTTVQGHAVISGQVRIGKHNQIGYGAVIGSHPQDLSFQPSCRSGVEIGEENVIREYCTIHRGTKPDTATVVGSRNFLMVGAHLGHNTHLGDNVVLANNVLLAGYVEVHDRAFIGGGVAVHQFTRIGKVAILQGSSATGKDIPPFCIASGRNSVVGINFIGLRRAGFDLNLRKEAREAFSLFYHQGLNAAQALEKARKQSWSLEIQPFWEFVASSKRGICTYAKWADIKTGTGESVDAM
jgi:UDP-N-acetylglucosamine acyltransferase